MAIAGALVAAPQAQHAFTTAARPGTVAAADAHAVLVSSTSTARHAATPGPAGNTHYKVKSGDTLSGIAEHYYHKAADWQWLYHENDKTVSDPNLIYPGETLFVPSDPPANFTLSSYVPKHAAGAAAAPTAAPSPSRPPRRAATPARTAGQAR
jgi:nucleoid-associated protein YgaU